MTPNIYFLRSISSGYRCHYKQACHGFTRTLGGEVSALHVVIAAVAGTVAMIPNIIGIPLIASLVDSGASYTTAAAFLTTLLMVGFITMPMEIRELGLRFALLRAGLSLIAVIGIALVTARLADARDSATPRP